MNTEQKIANLRAALADLGQDTRQWTDDDLVQRVLTGGPSRLPVWADTPAEYRVATLRAEAVHDGTDITGLSDLQVLGMALNRAWAEAQRHHNAYSMLLQDRVKEERSLRASTHRSALKDITAQAGLYMQAIIRRNASPIDGVIYRAEQIPEDGRMPVKAARELREAALRARWLLKGMASESAIADAAKDADVQELERLKAEIRRWERVASVIGQELHTEYGKKWTGRRCECVGCELIRELHTEGVSDDGVAGVAD